MLNKWKVTVLVEGEKELSLAKRVCHLDLQYRGSQWTDDDFPLDIAVKRKMSFFEAVSIYLKLSKMDIYSMFYRD